MQPSRWTKIAEEPDVAVAHTAVESTLTNSRDPWAPLAAEISNARFPYACNNFGVDGRMLWNKPPNFRAVEWAAPNSAEYRCVSDNLADSNAYSFSASNFKRVKSTFIFRVCSGTSCVVALEIEVCVWSSEPPISVLLVPVLASLEKTLSVFVVIELVLCLLTPRSFLMVERKPAFEEASTVSSITNATSTAPCSSRRKFRSQICEKPFPFSYAIKASMTSAVDVSLSTEFKKSSIVSVNLAVVSDYLFGRFSSRTWYELLRGLDEFE